MIDYHVIARKNPQNDIVKFYASPANLQVISIEQFYEAMALESTVTEHDLKAIISSLQQHLWDALREGKTVRFGDLGSFHITLKGKGSETAEDYSAENIEKVCVRFIPSVRFKYNMSVKHPYVKFNRVD